MTQLTACAVCKKEHADDVKRCPHCGAKYNKPITKRPLAIIMVAVVGYVAYSCSSTIDQSSRRAAAIEDAKSPEQKAADRQAATIAETLNDAYAGCQVATERGALFKDPKSIEWDPTQQRGNIEKKTVTGVVRAKNSFGAIVPQSIVCTFEITTGTTTRIKTVKFAKQH